MRAICIHLAICKLMYNFCWLHLVNIFWGARSSRRDCMVHVYPKNQKLKLFPFLKLIYNRKSYSVIIAIGCKLSWDCQLLLPLPSWLLAVVLCILFDVNNKNTQRFLVFSKLVVFFVFRKSVGGLYGLGYYCTKISRTWPISLLHFHQSQIEIMLCNNAKS